VANQTFFQSHNQSIHQSINRPISDMALRKKDSNMSINSDLNEEHKFGGGESSSKQQYETKTSRISSSIPAAAETSMIISDTISRRGGDSMVEVEMKEAKSKDDNTAVRTSHITNHRNA